MRSNLPVTQREYQFPGNETLLSTTDVTSHIAYANAAFVRTSGFSTEELIGQPHYLVRHPAMPEEAFADMWRSLKEGCSWTALVKNRRRDGDHYWVRTKPTRAEVAATEKLYARFKDGQASGLAFHRGLIVHTDLMRWASALQLLPTAWRVRLPLLLAGSVVGIALLFSGLEGTALVEQSSATALSMGDQAQRLVEAVKVFSI